MNESFGDLLDRAEVFFGAADPALARCYVRLGLPGEAAAGPPWQLAGSVRGPRCHYARTLQSRVALAPCAEAASPRDSQADRALLCEAFVPDPCFWTAELPMVYDVQLELRRGDELLATAQRTLGIRRLGVRQRRLYFDAQAWVLRGVWHSAVAREPLAQWRTAAAVMVADEPDEQLLAEATELGTLILAYTSATGEMLTARLARWSGFPALVGVVVCSAEAGELPLRRLVRNVPLFQEAAALESQGHAPSAAVAAWADGLIVPAEDPQLLRHWAEATSLPLIASRAADRPISLADARAQCDRLQREIAGNDCVGPVALAGYIVR